MPVLAVQPLDKGRTAVFCGDTTRNWQQGPLVLGQDSPFLRFWGQMVRWLAGRSEAVEEKAGVTATLDKAAYQPDEPIQIAAVVRDDKGQGSQTAQVKAKVQGPGRRRGNRPGQRRRAERPLRRRLSAAGPGPARDRGRGPTSGQADA